MKADGPLLALARASHEIEVWDHCSGFRLGSVALDQRVLALELVDQLLLAFSEKALRVIHLTPTLQGDACRHQRDAHHHFPQSLQCAPVREGKRLVWLQGEQLQLWQAQPQGLECLWSVPWRGECHSLSFRSAQVAVAGSHSLDILQADTGERLQRWRLEQPGCRLASTDSALWLADRGGNLWRCSPQGPQKVSASTRPHSHFGFALCESHALFTCGRHLEVVHLASARRHTLELPQPCLLDPLLGPGWAILSSYDGMLYRLQLESGPPQVVEAWRPFHSFEPSLTAPLLLARQLILAGPEGQLLKTEPRQL